MWPVRFIALISALVYRKGGRPRMKRKASQGLPSSAIAGLTAHALPSVQPRPLLATHLGKT